MEREVEEKIRQLENLINGAKRLVFFGGAGVSTESGIPDFRSKDGLYNVRDIRFSEYTPEYLLSHDCLVDEPEVFFEFYRQKMDGRACLPNAAHLKLKELEDAGILSAVVTQNIDDLHEKAGSRQIYHLHGTTFRNYCMGPAHHRLPADFIYENKENVPHCPVCGHIVRPDVTLYGESLPDDAVSGAVHALEQADVLIIAGTSLSVYPAASFIRAFGGDKLIVINRDETHADAQADLVLHEKVGEVLGQIKVKKN